MIEHVILNLQEIEAMLYFWQATSEREKVSESYINQLAAMPGLTMAYDQEFNAESVRKVLSAITNRERLSQMTKKEARFWSNNMWMLEDMSYVASIINPLKRLNLDDLPAILNQSNPRLSAAQLEVVVTALHFDDYLFSNNCLVINFFKLIPSEQGLIIQGVPIKEFITAQLQLLP